MVEVDRHLASNRNCRAARCPLTGVGFHSLGGPNKESRSLMLLFYLGLLFAKLPTKSIDPYRCRALISFKEAALWSFMLSCIMFGTPQGARRTLSPKPYPEPRTQERLARVPRTLI